MKNDFEINYSGHERAARDLLLREKKKTERELAVMTGREVEMAINEEYVAIQAGEDWLLISKDKYEDFQEIAEWIDR